MLMSYSHRGNHTKEQLKGVQICALEYYSIINELKIRLFVFVFFKVLILQAPNLFFGSQNTLWDLSLVRSVEIIFGNVYNGFPYRTLAGLTSAAPLKSAVTPQLSSGTMWFTFWVAHSSFPSSVWTATTSWRTAGTPSWVHPHLATVWLPALPRERSIHLGDQK